MASNLTSPLPLNLNATDLYSEYKHWMNSYLIYELASGVSTKKDDVKRATLLHCLGPQVQRIFFNLPEEKDTYEKAKEALTKYFTPQKNIVSERFKFRQRKQNTDENIDSYVIALRELVKSCEFGNLEEDMIRDQIIEKCYNRQLKEKLLQQDNLNLQRTIEISRMFETAKEEFRVLTNEDMTSINRVNYKNNFQAANESTVKGSKAHNVYHQKGSTSKVSAPNLEECYRCGLTTHPPYKCGARNMKCTFCNKMGHLNRVCRNKNKYKNIEGKKRNIQNISENNEDSDEYTFFLGSDNKESIYIDGKEIKMTIDTGSDTTFIGLENLKNIFPKSQMPTLNGTERKFYAYGQTSPLPCCGYFFADISWGERSIKEQIFVIEGKAEPLLGKKASFELEIIKRGTKIRNIQQEVIPKDIYNLIQENMNLFQGQGNVKGYSQKITLKENVTPVAQRCRHFPYKMVEAINQELDKMIEDGIFEEVHEASEWISNIVAVPKKGTEEIRLCVDLKEVMEHNQAYKERMKKYADSKNKALPHDFKKGNIVYVANTEMRSKLTPNYDNQRFIILETISPNSFKLVNTETGSFIIRNAKHLRHANVLQDFNKGIDLNTTLIKTPEIRMELPSTSRFSRLPNPCPADPLRVKLGTYSGQPLKVFGTLDVPVQYQNSTQTLPLMVVGGEGPSLCGRNCMEALGILPTQPYKVDMNKVTENNLPTQLHRFRELFKPGYGVFKGVRARLLVDPEMKPRFFKSRPIPYALKEKISRDLDRLVKTGILKPVRHAEWAAPIVPVLKFGIPRTLVSDNGTGFTSEEFRHFMTRNGIRHLQTAPFHPSSNGLAERAVQTIKTGLKKVQQGSISQRLAEILLGYRRTPIASIVKSPSEMMFGHNFRSRLDLILPNPGKSEEPGFKNYRSKQYRRHIGGGVCFRNWRCSKEVEEKKWASQEKKVCRGPFEEVLIDKFQKRGRQTGSPAGVVVKKGAEIAAFRHG
ncbi:hypothetical protein LAZ67_9001912, partial [Cordylochernes scorpioides]